MAGHTVQRCYKLHGYPPRHKLYKGKRMAALAEADAGSEYNNTQAQDVGSTNPAVPSLTHE